jgi:hypothetical protein
MPHFHISQHYYDQRYKHIKGLGLLTILLASDAADSSCIIAARKQRRVSGPDGKSA